MYVFGGSVFYNFSAKLQNPYWVLDNEYSKYIINFEVPINFQAMAIQMMEKISVHLSKKYY